MPTYPRVPYSPPRPRAAQAFLVVLGTNGLLVDGCPVFPNPSTAPGAAPITVPLPNNSSIEIHKKRFVFTYPPKDLRPALIATPARDAVDSPEKHRRRRALRMSMIHTAQVFSPRPSSDARENLRILKTPIKMRAANPFRGSDEDEEDEDEADLEAGVPGSARRRRASSPLKRGMFATVEEEEEEADDAEGGEEEVVLVEGSRPRVFQEERDLVILEHVQVPEPAPASPSRPHAHTPQQHTPRQGGRTPAQPAQVRFPFVAPSPAASSSAAPATPKPPKTPQRRARPSLHKAVLLRSAMRREMEAEEREQEEEEEAMEVEESVIEDGDGEGEGEGEGAAGGMEEEEEGEGEEEEDADMQDEEHEEVCCPAVHTFMPHDILACTLSAFCLSSCIHSLTHSQAAGSSTSQYPTPHAQRPPVLGHFMTPQISRHHNRPVPSTVYTSRTSGHPYARYSVGGFTPGGIHGAMAAPAPIPQGRVSLARAEVDGTPRTSGPRRVRLVEPWRVEDIVVEEQQDDGEDVKEDDRDLVVPLKDADEDEKEDISDAQHEENVDIPMPMTPGRAKREKLSEEERKVRIVYTI